MDGLKGTVRVGVTLNGRYAEAEGCRLGTRVRIGADPEGRIIDLSELSSASAEYLAGRLARRLQGQHASPFRIYVEVAERSDVEGYRVELPEAFGGIVEDVARGLFDRAVEDSPHATNFDDLEVPFKLNYAREGLKSILHGALPQLPEGTPQSGRLPRQVGVDGFLGGGFYTVS